MFGIFILSRGGEVASREAHNLEIAGSNPAPATRKNSFLFIELHSITQERNLLASHARQNNFS